MIYLFRRNKAHFNAYLKNIKFKKYLIEWKLWKIPKSLIKTIAKAIHRHCRIRNRDKSI
jgi:hypothetical protein